MPLSTFPPSQSNSVLTTGVEHADVRTGSDDSVDRQPADAPESSPSTGAEELTEELHAVYGLGDRGEVVTTATLDADGDSEQYLKDFFQVTS